MKKIAKKLIAVILCALVIVVAIIPAALAAGAGEKTGEKTDGTNGGNGTETASKKHGRHGRHEDVELPENAIGSEAAKEAALAEAGLSAEEVERLRACPGELDGTVVYKVHFYYNGQKYSYRIDAVSGEILVNNVTDAEESSCGHFGHGRHGRRGSEDSSLTEAPADGAAING